MQTVDLVLHHGTIYQVDHAFSVQQAIAIHQGRIVAVGPNEEILGSFRAIKQIDLAGATVYPGFIDPHGHIHRYARQLAEVNLSGCRSEGDMYQRILAVADQTDGWLVGRGWDQHEWEVPIFPQNTWLNTHFPERPVLLERIDIHASLVNQVVLDQLGFSPETHMDGGQLLQNHGQLTGMLIDAAHQAACALIPPPTESQWRKLLLEAQQHFWAAGLTGIGDAWLTHEEATRLDELIQAGEWNMPVYGMMPADPFHLAHYLSRPKTPQSLLQTHAFKLFADGTFGSRSAWLSKPYTDDPSTSGLSMLDTDQTIAVAKQIAQAGYQLNVHAIGDAAISQVLDIFEAAMPAGNPYRWRIEHAQLMDDTLLQRFQALEVMPSPQPLQATSDQDWLPNRLGPDRLPYAHRLQSLASPNRPLPLSTDFPIESIDPIHTFFSAIYRKPWQRPQSDPFQYDEALSPKTALTGITYGAAYAQHQEHEVGSLEEGKVANLVVLDNDLLTIHEKELFSTKKVFTIAYGRIVYSTAFT